MVHFQNLVVGRAESSSSSSHHVVMSWCTSSSRTQAQNAKIFAHFIARALLETLNMLSIAGKKFTAKSSLVRGFKVAVVGSNGGCGQPMSLLLKLSPLVTSLSLFDVKGRGVGADLSHICAPVHVCEHTGAERIDEALVRSDIVVIPAGCPRVAGENPLLLSRDSLFDSNAPMIHSLAEKVAELCPKAMVLIVSNPVNSLTPLFAEVMKKKGVHDPRRTFGVTTLDIIRANTFAAEALDADVLGANVNVIGGHGCTTILPLFSQVPGADKFSEKQADSLTQRVKYGGDEVVRAKAGDGSATLSTAYATVRFAERLMRAMRGEQGVVECAFVENNLTESPFFSTPLLLGPIGVEKACTGAHYLPVSSRSWTHWCQFWRARSGEALSMRQPPVVRQPQL